VDLLWVHVWEFLTPVEEVMRALDDVVRAGKVLYVGVSDVPAWVVARANTLAELRGWTPFAGLQIEYSLVQRTVERELVPAAGALDLAVLAWAPLGRGLLTGKYSTGESGEEPRRLSDGDDKLSERNLAVAAAVGEVARELDARPSQVALAWLCARPRAVVIPIVGARTAAQIQESLGAAELELPEEALLRLDEASRIELGFPHDFLAAVLSRGGVEAIDDHRRSLP